MDKQCYGEQKTNKKVKQGYTRYYTEDEQFSNANTINKN